MTQETAANPGVWLAAGLGVAGLIGVVQAVLTGEAGWLLCGICGFGLAGCVWLLGMIRNRL